MNKFLPTIILGAMIALAVFAADVWNVGVASVDTSGNAIFGGTVTATGAVSAASVTTAGAVTAASVTAPVVNVSTSGVVVGGFKIVNATSLVFIAGAVTNVIDANIGG